MEGIKHILKLIESPSGLYDSGFYEGKNDGYFVNSIGAGFDAVISKKANKSKVKKWLNYVSLGKAIYAYHLIAEIFRYQPSTLDIMIDGQPHRYEKKHGS